MEKQSTEVNIRAIKMKTYIYIYKKIFKIPLIVVYSSPQLDESHAGNLIIGFSDSPVLSDYNSQKRDFLNKGTMPDAFDGLTRAII